MNADAGGYLANAFAAVGIVWAVAWYWRWAAYYNSLRPADECDDCDEIGDDLDTVVGALVEIIALADSDAPPVAMVGVFRSVAERALTLIGREDVI